MTKSHDTGAADATLPTVGVEEEIPHRGSRDAAAGPAGLRRPCPGARGGGVGRVQGRAAWLASQIETASSVTSGSAELRAGLRDSRTALASAAAAVGADLHSAGFALDHTVPLAVSRDERYRAIEERYAGVTADYPACGCHVHVGVPDRETAVAVVNHLRPWLPTLLALSANSPYARGVDSGCASWRAVDQRRFPGAGVPPWCADAAAYNRAMDAQLAAGATVDRQMTFWYAPAVEHVPTVEVRAADAAATVEEAVLQAGLTRGLGRPRTPRPAPPDGPRRRPATRSPRAAVWSAARYGLDGPAVDFADGRTTPALSLVGKLPSARRARPRGVRATDSWCGPTCTASCAGAPVRPGSAVPPQAAASPRPRASWPSDRNHRRSRSRSSAAPTRFRPADPRLREHAMTALTTGRRPAVTPETGPLPRPRGPVSDAVIRALHRPPGSGVDALGTDAPDAWGEDAQLALYACYELHYRGFRDVDADWEWDLDLHRVRGELETRFLSALRTDTGTRAGSGDAHGVGAPGDVDAALTGLLTADSDDAPASRSTCSRIPIRTCCGSTSSTGRSTTSRRPTRTPCSSPGCPGARKRAW
ncbi:glutamate-cysteine ligase family protein [Yinghuangia aomiensis]